MLRVRRAAASLVVSAGLLVSANAQATPQGTVGLTVGAAGVSPGHPDTLPVPAAADARAFWKETDFHLGLRGDVLFARTRPTDFGVGPYAEVLMHGFRDFQFGGGGSVLLPVLNTYPIVVSEGLYGRKDFDGGPLTAGVATTLFWGTRSYNYHASYIMSAGLLGELRYGLGANHETAIVVGAQLDLVVLSLPFVLLVNTLRGGSRDVRPVKTSD